MIKKLFYDGDSYSCTLGPGIRKNSGEILANNLDLQLRHYGKPGKSHFSIIRTAMRYCFNGWHKDSFMCVGIGIGYRFDSVGSEIQHSKNLLMDEDRYTFTLPQKKRAIIYDLIGTDYIHHNMFLDVISLHDFLLMNKANFIIHNFGYDYKIDKNLPFANGIEEQIRLRPRILNFLENSLHGLMTIHNMPGWDEKEYGNLASHPSEDGHEMYAGFLYPHIIKYVDLNEK